jgi:DNA-binding CsgD family transcriptional regulator
LQSHSDGVVVEVVDVVEGPVLVVGPGVPAAAAALTTLSMTGAAQTMPPAAAAFLMSVRLDSIYPPPQGSRLIVPRGRLAVERVAPDLLRSQGINASGLSIELDRSGGADVERLSEREKEEIARLSAMGLPSRLIGHQIGRHHRTVWGHIARLRSSGGAGAATFAVAVVVA